MQIEIINIRFHYKFKMTIRISKTHFLDRSEFSAEKLAQEVLANYTFGDIHPNVIVEEDEIVLLYDLPQHINKLFDTICEECNRQHWMLH